MDKGKEIFESLIGSSDQKLRKERISHGFCLVCYRIHLWGLGISDNILHTRLLSVEGVRVHPTEKRPLFFESFLGVVVFLREVLHFRLN